MYYCAGYEDYQIVKLFSKFDGSTKKMEQQVYGGKGVLQDLTVDSLPKGTFTITFEHFKGETDKPFNMGLSIYAKKKVAYK
jgi:hypothetical protein